jgi:hypothetical protein
MPGGRTYAHIVRVSVVRGGGFGGLIRTTTADAKRLSPGDRQELAVLVRQAGLSGAPATPDSAEPEPDRFSYLVTVQDEGQERKIGFSERSLPEGVRNLISWIAAVDGHEESIGPPGTAGR